MSEQKHDVDVIPLMFTNDCIVLSLSIYRGKTYLWWQYSGVLDGPRAVLVCAVTEDEAQAVYDRDPLVGVLEPIRSTLADPVAVVATWDLRDRRTLFEAKIPSRGSEGELLAYLDSFAARSDQFTRQLATKAETHTFNEVDQAVQHQHSVVFA